MRIGVGGLHVECSTYNPVPTTTVDFRILRGEELLRDPYFAWLNEDDCTVCRSCMPVPSLAGRSLGKHMKLSKPSCWSAFQRWKNLDSVYLAMHGAIYIEDMDDAEGDFVAAVLELVGPDCLISASYDLHRNLSQRIIDNLDMFTTYRTAPHIDVEATMRGAVTEAWCFVSDSTD